MLEGGLSRQRGEVPSGVLVFLTAEELRNLTGRVRPSAQIRWLRSRHWVFDVRADGRPVVAEAEACRQLCGSVAKPGTTEPNMEALDGMG